MNNALLVSLFVIFGIVFTNVATAEISVADCEAQIIANKNLQILKGKMDLLNSANQPIEILANGNIPSRKEKEAVALWAEEQRRCSKPGIDYHRSQSPEVGAIFDKAYSELFLSAADLYQGKITYGDFARATVKRHQDVREQIAAVVARFREQQAANAQQEAERQRYLQQERCASLRQQILAISSSPTPYQIRQQRRAEQEQSANRQCANRPESTRDICYSNSMAGAGLGEILAGSIGAVDPLMAEAQQRQAALAEQTEIYQRECRQ